MITDNAEREKVIKQISGLWDEICDIRGVILRHETAILRKQLSVNELLYRLNGTVFWHDKANHCTDCGKAIDDRSERCSSCANTHRFKALAN